MSIKRGPPACAEAGCSIRLGARATPQWSTSALLHATAVVSLANSQCSQPLSPRLGFYCIHSPHSSQGVILKMSIWLCQFFAQEPSVGTRSLVHGLRGPCLVILVQLALLSLSLVLPQARYMGLSVSWKFTHVAPFTCPDLLFHSPPKTGAPSHSSLIF